ncbi:MAG: metallophosphoesterase family protein [Candidatus Eremiobacteraeota bacterium]|nr:metallophosphoesterase family protein [Candidatus Eremiobacteraeota bacterium]
MKHAIVSDIHSNLEALDAALGTVSADCDLWCLGDIVGYGPQPNECIALIRERASACVLGNHDVAAIDDHGLEYFNAMARDALEYTQRVLTPENAAWLDGLPYELRLDNELLVHGAPVTYFEYIFDKGAARRAFEATDARIVFVGHTHVAEYWTLEPDGSIGHQHMQFPGSLTLDDGKRYIVDVGSVGQPRDLNRDASHVVYDPDERSVRWERTPYEIGRVQEKIEQAHLPSILARRLAAGR